MNKKKILLIVVAVAAVAGFIFLKSSNASRNSETAPTPTPLAEETLYITFDGNGGYTVLDAAETKIASPELLAQLTDPEIKKQLITFFPDTLTLLGNYEATTLSEVASKPNRTCLFSCVAVLPETDSFTGFPKTSKDIYIYELAGFNDVHVYNGVPQLWLLELRKSAFLKYRVNKMEQLPLSVQNTLIYTETLFEDCLKTKIIETSHRLYSILGEEFPIYKINYNIDLNGHIVTLFDSYIAKINDRYLELCFETKDLSKFTLNFIDITADDFVAEEFTADSTSVDEPESIDNNTNQPSGLAYATYDEYLEVVVPQIVEALEAYLRNSENVISDVPNETQKIAQEEAAETSAITHMCNIILGDYHVLEFAEARKQALEEANKTLAEQSAITNGNSSAIEMPDESETESEEGFFKRLISKIPFLNKDNKEPAITEDTE